MSMDQEIWIFGDGACKGNPGPGGWGCIVAEADRVWELGGGLELTTNNQMELQALASALALLHRERPVATGVKVFFDSKYVINGAQFWRHGWSRKAWRTSLGEDVKNVEEWKDISALLDQLTKTYKFKWYFVEGHAGIEGNERVDQIASDFAEFKNPDLYQGSRKEYGVDLSLGIERAEAITKAKPVKRGGPARPAYYLSCINGRVFKDSSWAACEARVKGVSGAKFKKVHSAEEEQEVIRGWKASY